MSGEETILAIGVHGGLGGTTEGPEVSEVELPEQVDGGGVRAAIVYRDADENVVSRSLGVFDLDVEVSI